MNPSTLPTTRSRARVGRGLAIVLMAGLGLGTLSQSALAQGERAPAPPGERELDGAALRERLVRQRQDLVRAQTLMDEAIARLDKGEPIADLLRELAALRMGPRGGGPGGRREGGAGREGPGGDDRMGEEPRDGFRDGPRDGPREQLREGRPDGGDDLLMDIRPGDTLSDAQRERIMGFLKENAPRFAAKIEDLQNVDPKTADRLFVRMAPRIREAMAVRRRDPELFELRLDEIRGGFAVIEAVKAYRDAKSSPENGREARVAQAEAAAREALIAQFEQRRALEAHEITTMGTRLEERRRDFDSRGTERDAIIERLITRLRENKPLPDGPPRRGPEGRPGGEPGGRPGDRPDDRPPPPPPR